MGSVDNGFPAERLTLMIVSRTERADGGWVVLLLAVLMASGCGQGTDIAAQQQALRSPERIQAKTAEILSPDAPSLVTVSDIHLRKSDRGKSLIVEWTALGPQGTFKCNADKRVDFPECDLQPPGQ
ncbi:MAG: hypothetical protein EBZ36_14885 [Acidobacteria bacterium]|nr:hypothetical protein [Acidobacteriota bacterium]